MAGLAPKNSMSSDRETGEKGDVLEVYPQVTVATREGLGKQKFSRVRDRLRGESLTPCGGPCEFP